ncbi:WbqC family protein [Saccharicrinis fermentans]|uniref:WbqC-like protein family protein n=1 Tax=Saccharicrinis fermentans DSM 9555 = JCM 21142 TaxID=869213 RepID=W7YKR8_9BACT|nr:WbqC family protein [Saccharicrinis fermentans]GAF05106.1 WbqC-like protein family protein [Saccharicrinis fermentans DSM 9555 = JCM 21142]
MNNTCTLFTTAYLPPVQYLAHMLYAENPVMEHHDHYVKQTYRNRCDIMGANGAISLTVPVAKGRRLKVKTKDLEISYDERWQALHWRSIVSAYSSSPFFEFYMDDFKPFYEQKYRFLFDFNLKLLQVIYDALDCPLNVKLTDAYVAANAERVVDYRELIHPKKNYAEMDRGFKVLEYRQVFQDRFSFTPNLSVIDLIFNKGPEAIDYLEESIVMK